MKKLLTSILALTLLFAPTVATVSLVVLNTGCASVAEGSDPTVVNAERLSAGAFDIIDSFLQYEHANRQALWNVDQSIKQVADKLRDETPVAIESLRNATKAYKSNKTPEGLATLKTLLAVVNQLLADATVNMTKALKQ